MKRYKYYLIVAACFGLFALGAGLNTWFEPHLDVQATPAFEAVKADDFVNNALTDINSFNEKYLSEDGDSKIIELEGKVDQISTNMNDETVILLKDDTSKDAGVMCTLIKEEGLILPAKGQKIIVKGIVRSGAEYDEDLEMYIDAVLEKAKIAK